jgi:hypothetical protein
MLTEVHVVVLRDWGEGGGVSMLQQACLCFLYNSMLINNIIILAGGTVTKSAKCSSPNN